LAAARGVSQGDAALVEVLRDLEQGRSRAAEAYQAVVRSLAAALQARDGYSGEHSGAVQGLSISVAHRLGLDARMRAEVEAVALLHDIGKIGIPDQILHKEGPLDAEEWRLMREHPVIGERILRPLPGLASVATAVRHEHERWDGDGYPDGIAGEAIPLASRVVLACDTYDALVTDRPYRKALGHAAAVAELRRCSGTQFDPRVVEALLACLADPAPVVAAMSAEDLAAVLTDSGAEGHERRLERELHGLIGVASAVGAAHRMEELVEVAAEETLQATCAGSVSISQWDRHLRELRTLINAGDRGPGEERWPQAETYALEGDDAVRILLEEGGTYRCSLDDADILPTERTLLLELGKHHCVGVPIFFAGRPWGELWAARGAEQSPFDERDERFMLTVAGQIASAIGRAELFGRMAELAFEDPLTGVANRRALDEHLDEAVRAALEAGTDLAVLLCDVDNLKELNDTHGHEGGDDALVRVAAALRASTGDGPDVLVARIGGDEFAVVLEGATAEEARTVGERLLELLAFGEAPILTVSCGVASLGGGTRRVGDLLRSADAAQYIAKRSGRARVTLAVRDLEDTWRDGADDRRAFRGRAEGVAAPDVAALVGPAVAALDGRLATRSALDRLEIVALECAAVVDATAISVSWWAPGQRIDTLFAVDCRAHETAGERYGTTGETYDIEDFPATERIMTTGGSFVVHVDDPDSDPAEIEPLERWGMRAMLAAAAVGEDGSWLVEIYADGATLDLVAAEPALRLLVAEAVRGAGRPHERMRLAG
jgi:diguanylate cyclase (GGDEF)-like protein